MVRQIVFVIDKSGSMAGSEVRVVTAYNELLEEQKAEPGEMLMTTILFDTRAVTTHDCVEIQHAVPLSRKDYVPSGSTALLDTVGDAVTAIKVRNDSTGGLLAIITDGMENASTRYTHEAVKKLLTELKDSGWDIRYIGADLTDFADAERMGIKIEQRMSIAKEHLSSTMKDISSGIKELRKGNPMGFPKPSRGKPFDKTLPYKTTAQGGALIDTGSPVSFGDIDAFMMDRDSHPIAKNPLIKEIRRHLGAGVAAVIGMNILRHYDLRIDYTPQVGEYHVHHAHTPQLRVEQGTPLRYEMGIPVVDAAVNGEIIPLFVDTGSHHTFIDQVLVRGSESGTAHDFYPSLGTFESPTYHTTLSLCGCDFAIQAAVLPRSLQHLLRYSGVKGIIGLDVLKHQRTWLGFLSGVLAFEVSGTSRT